VLFSFENTKPWDRGKKNDSTVYTGIMPEKPYWPMMGFGMEKASQTFEIASNGAENGASGDGMGCLGEVWDGGRLGRRKLSENGAQAFETLRWPHVFSV
jgi:hypothetical protein